MGAEKLVGGVKETCGKLNMMSLWQDETGEAHRKHDDGEQRTEPKREISTEVCSTREIRREAHVEEARCLGPRDNDREKTQ
jgi:hypothetical protein